MIVRKLLLSSGGVIVSAVAVATAAARLATASDKPAARAPASAATRPATRPVVAVRRDVPKDFVEHEIGESGASLRLPADWKARSDDDKLNAGSADLKTILSVAATDPEAEVDVHEDVKTLPAQIAEATGGKVVSADVIQFGEHRAVRFVLDVRSKRGNDVRQCQVFVGTKKHYYLFSIGGSVEGGEGRMAILEQILSSAKLP